jgi:two-component system LytT family response regulator
MRVLVIEDEAPAREWLALAIRRVEPAATVAGTAGSVAEALDWLAQHPTPDLVLADIQLGDGLSLEIFDRAPPGCPVIFCTAYDEFAIAAMQRDAIDYLLKPVREADLARALAKRRRLEAHFTERVTRLARELGGAAAGGGARRRLLVRRRDAFVALGLDEVAYFVVDDKLVDVVTRDARRFAVERTLADLETELTAAGFFRVNRQYLVHAAAVASFRPFVKGKLVVELTPAAGDEVVVSQENAARFRAWLGG